MAHLILILSGLADDPHEALDGATPLARADTPALDQLSAMSEIGLVQALPERELDDPAIGCDLTTFALFGEQNVFTGRGAVELLGAGAPMGRRDAGLRLDLIHTASGLDPFPPPPSLEDARELWATLAPVCSQGPLVVRGISPLTALGLWREGPVEVAASPPGQLAESELDEQLPSGDGEEAIRRLIDDAREALDGHPVNLRRAAAELPALDAVWPWGFGRAPEVRLFVLHTGHVASVITDSRAVRGVARAAGISAPAVPEAPRSAAELAAAGLGALDHAPTVVIHTAAADAAGHRGEPEQKLEAIEEIDRDLVAPCLKRLETERGLSLTVLADYACLCRSRRHANRPVPYLAFRPDRTRTGPGRWSEAEAADTGHTRTGAVDLMSWLWGR